VSALQRRYGRARAEVPSAEQAGVLRKLVDDPEHRLVRQQGGFWTTRSTATSHHVPTGRYYEAHDVPAWWTGTLTVRAMEKRGWLARANVTDKEWADERELTDEGRAALLRYT
jgi:hypothetical protein